MSEMHMNRLDSKPDPKRRYPTLYEKVVPVALVFIGASIIVLMGIIVAVVLRVFPFAI
jgi:hypothetical protein